MVAGQAPPPVPSFESGFESRGEEEEEEEQERACLGLTFEILKLPLPSQFGNKGTVVREGRIFIIENTH